LKKSERMNAIIYMLKEKGKLSAGEIARLLEVSERTVYRDIDALSQTKVPIIAYEGNQGGYEIDPGYFIPSIVLTEEEITSFILLLRLGKELKIPGLHKHYDMLHLKLLNAVSRDSRPNLERFLHKFQVYVNRINPGSYAEQVLEIIIQSFEEEKKVKLSYYTPGTDTLSVREVSPYRFTFDEGGWYLTGYCHLRKDKRTFRLDRITSIELMDSPCCFPRGITFDEIGKEKQRYLLQMDRHFYEIIRHNYYMEDHKILENNTSLVVELYTDYEDSILELALKNATFLKVIEPQCLCKKIKKIADNLAGIYP
jgi:predicted DNA-binding transcriptional regulator YafY